MATKIDKNGMLVSSQIILRRYPRLEHGRLKEIRAVVVHQTDSSSEQATLNSYAIGSNQGNGAHFLIGKSGTIYQTASVRRCCYHVGALIKSRCLALGPKNCSDPAYTKLATLNWRQQINLIDKNERTKPYPERYPVNHDSIGIELVGSALGPRQYETPGCIQNTALQWLVAELTEIFQLDVEGDVFRHPEVSYKNPGEAKGSIW